MELEQRVEKLKNAALSCRRFGVHARRHCIAAGLVLAYLGASACSPAGVGVAAVEQNGLSAEVDAYLSELYDSGRFNGVAMVTFGGSTLLAKGYGFANIELSVPLTPQSKFRIGSITKPFTAMGIMILQERGALRVEDTLGSHLSDIPEHWQGITLHQLLTHTSGIMHSWSLPRFAATQMVPRTLDETLARYHDRPLLFEPGTSVTYSGVGYSLLAKVIETSTGLTYEQFLRAEIFTPLGMDDTGADRPEVILENRASGYRGEEGVLVNAASIHMPILTGGGNLYSTAEDLSRWDRGLTAGRLISAAGYEAIYTPRLDDNYGYSWEVRERDGMRVSRHGGSVPGFRTHILRIPEAELCVIVLTNVVQQPRPRPIIDRLVDIVLGSR